MDFEVVIVGAGMAGLAAARVLAERGVKVCVLEAQDRVGGRIFSRTVQDGGVVEMGAEFVHGRTPEIWALIAEAGVETVERDGTMLREGWGGDLEVEDAEDESIVKPLEVLEKFAGEDVAFWDWLKASDVPKLDRPGLLGYVEGFNAADARRIGVLSLGAQQRAEDENEGDRAWHVVGGYGRLTEYLAGRVRELGGEIRQGCEVLGIRWKEGEVCVETAQGDVLSKRCVVTLPLGVLHRVNMERGVWMEPEPAAIAQARRLEMGDAVRFSMMFRERWWVRSEVLERKALEAMSFLFTPQRMPPVWWTDHPGEAFVPSGAEAPDFDGSGMYGLKPVPFNADELFKADVPFKADEPFNVDEPFKAPAAFRADVPMLTGWVGGPRAKTMRGKTAEQIGETACAALAEVFGLEAAAIREALVSTEVHDWAGDPFSLGVYSYVPVGAMEAPAAMTVPEEGTIFFAGEHTDVTGHWGTVHAALRSGLRVAEQVLEASSRE